MTRFTQTCAYDNCENTADNTNRFDNHATLKHLHRINMFPFFTNAWIVRTCDEHYRDLARNSGMPAGASPFEINDRLNAIGQASAA